MQLRDELVLVFNESELRRLAGQLEIPYSSLRGKTQRDRFGVLIGRMERQGRLPDLVMALVTANPTYAKKYRPYLETNLPGQLDENARKLLIDISKSGPVIEEPPTMKWDTQVRQKRDDSE
ncbi:MAG: hypothetical protein AAF490_28080 [Chloroflexota bacterium]